MTTKNREWRFEITEIDPNEVNVHDLIKRSEYTPIDDVMQSIREIGIYKPLLIIDKDNNLLSGYRCYKAVCELGYKKVIAIRVLDDKLAKLIPIIEAKTVKERSPVEKAKLVYLFFLLCGINKNPKYINNSLRRGNDPRIKSIAKSIAPYFGKEGDRTIRRLLSILTLPKDIQDEIDRRWHYGDEKKRGNPIFSLHILESLSEIKSEDYQRQVFKIIDDMNVSKADDFIKAIKNHINQGNYDLVEKILDARDENINSLIKIAKITEYNSEMRNKAVKLFEKGHSVCEVLSQIKDNSESLMRELRWEDIYEEKCDIEETKHFVFCGDSEIVLDRILDKTGGELIDLVVTSPPYFGGMYEVEKDQWQTYDDYLHKMKNIFRKVYDLLKDGARICVVVPSVDVHKGKRYPLWADMIKILQDIEFEFRECITWIKQKGIGKGASNFIRDRKISAYTPNYITEQIIVMRKGNYFESKYRIREELVKYYLEDYLYSAWNIPVRGKYHEFGYPEKLAELLVFFFSDPREWVLDMFAGAGSTGVACKRLFRNSIQIERQPRYIEIIRKRLLEDCNIEKKQYGDKIVIEAYYRNIKLKYVERKLVHDDKTCMIITPAK